MAKYQDLREHILSGGEWQIRSEDKTLASADYTVMTPIVCGRLFIRGGWNDRWHKTPMLLTLDPDKRMNDARDVATLLRSFASWIDAGFANPAAPATPIGDQS